jgi:hypothetical protein
MTLADAMPDALPLTPEAEAELTALLGTHAAFGAERALADMVLDEAKKSDLPVTIFLKETGRAVTVHPSGKRVLMNARRGQHGSSSQTGAA